MPTRYSDNERAEGERLAGAPGAKEPGSLKASFRSTSQFRRTSGESPPILI